LTVRERPDDRGIIADPADYRRSGMAEPGLDLADETELAESGKER
jgi:hypothetical protein